MQRLRALRSAELPPKEEETIVSPSPTLGGTFSETREVSTTKMAGGKRKGKAWPECTQKTAEKTATLARRKTPQGKEKSPPIRLLPPFQQGRGGRSRQWRTTACGDLQEGKASSAVRKPDRINAFREKKKESPSPAQCGLLGGKRGGGKLTLTYSRVPFS